MTVAVQRSDVAQELFDIWHSIRRVTAEQFNRDGLSFPRAKVLWAIHHNGALRSRSVADHLDCSAATVTELVDALIRDGLVTRSPDPKDRRASLIDLTEAGRRVAEDSAARKRAVLDEIFTRLSQDELEQLKTLLDRLATSPTLQGDTP